MLFRSDVKKIRGQGYDGASNMRGEWNGLQAKFMEECPYAYYVHCFAHQLQLALVAAAKEVADVHNFFDHLALVVTIVVSSSKRNDELHAHQVAEMENLIELSELQTGRVDDLIGVFGDPTQTGKSTTSDLRSGKQTPLLQIFFWICFLAGLRFLIPVSSPQ